MVADQTVNEEVVESRWQHPTNTSTTVIVDAVEGETVSTDVKAAQVRAAVSAETAGYEEVSFQPVSLGGREAIEWVFRGSGRQKVDYFVNACGVGYAILGASTPSSFRRYERTFRNVAESLEPSCVDQNQDGSRANDPSGDSAPSPSPDTGGPSTSEANCGTIPDLGPTGMDPADAKDIRAKGLPCDEARGVVRTWFRRHLRGQERFGPWKCRSTTRSRQHVRCTADGSREVRFYLG